MKKEMKKLEAEIRDLGDEFEERGSGISASTYDRWADGGRARRIERTVPKEVEEALRRAFGLPLSGSGVNGEGRGRDARRSRKTE